jgi:putative DNA primase/helicase
MDDLVNLTLQAAYAYIDRGWAVFPIQPNEKLPATVNGVSDASTDPAQIQSWFGNGNPREYNIGIRAGDSLAIVDEDFQHGGHETLRAMPAQDFQTPTVKTPSGGHHYYYSPNGRDCKAWVGFLPGVDLRVQNSYVVAPPSTIDGKTYEWVRTANDLPLLNLPDWVKAKEKAGKTVKPYQDPTPISPGRWHTTMTSIAGVEVQQAQTEQELFGRLVAISQARSHPDHKTHTEADLQQLLRLASDAWADWNRERNFERTERGQSLYFADLYPETVRYSHRANSWYFFQDHWWVKDDGGKIKHLIETSVDHRAAKIGSLPDDQKEGERKFIGRCGNSSTLKGVFDIAKNNPTIGRSQIEWEPDPSLLGVLNGVVDLKTGELLPGTPEQMIYLHTRVPYNPDAKAPRWERFLQEVFAGDESLIDFVHRALGLSLTGLTKEQVFFLCYGSGANGKSTLLQTVRNVLGDYGMNARIESFVSKGPSGSSTIPNDIMEMKGRRYVITSEPSSTVTLDESRLKMLTGGENTRARLLNKNEEEFTPVPKIWISFNKKPNIRDDTNSFWRRVRFIPFTVKFDGDKRDVNIQEDLAKEHEGILAWLVRGAVSYYTTNLVAPAQVLASTEAYRAESDLFGQFITDTLQSGTFVSRKEVKESYRAWRSQDGDNDIRPWELRELDKRLATDYGRKKIAGNRGYGAELRNPLVTGQDSPKVGY